MRAILLTFLLLLSTPAPPPPFTAMWQTATSARISWQQEKGVHLTCLRRNATLIRCWIDLPPGEYVVELGSAGSLDGRMRPAVGDVYVLTQDAETWRAQLRSVVFLPAVRGGMAPPTWRGWLPIVRR